jgi:hypothetical protein
MDKLSVEDASALHPWAPLLWGGNARTRGDRIRSLGWKPEGPSVFDSLPSMVTKEAQTLGSKSQSLTFDS